jgi:hypothetical protein
MSMLATGKSTWWRLKRRTLPGQLKGTYPVLVFTIAWLGNCGWSVSRIKPPQTQHAAAIHSQTPEEIRLLIERVSPGPYLELFGRAEVHEQRWTVFGDQVERRLF